MARAGGRPGRRAGSGGSGCGRRPRTPVAGVQDEVQRGRGEPDQRSMRRLLRPVSHSGRPRSRKGTLARDVGRRGHDGAVITAGPDASVHEVAELMRERNVGSSYSSTGTPGRLHHRPGHRALGRRRGATRVRRAGEHASSPVIRRSRTWRSRKRQRMVRHGVRRLVVVGRVVAGVVTLDDLASRGLEPELASRVTRAAMPEYFFQLAAADDRLRERADHRVRAGPVARQLGLEERARKNGCGPASSERARRRRPRRGRRRSRPPLPAPRRSRGAIP